VTKRAPREEAPIIGDAAIWRITSEKRRTLPTIDLWVMRQHTPVPALREADVFVTVDASVLTSSFVAKKSTRDESAMSKLGSELEVSLGARCSSSVH